MSVVNKFFEHVVYDQFQNLLFKFVSTGTEETIKKAAEYFKSLPFGLSLSDEENYLYAEIYARDELKVTPAQINTYHLYLKKLTPAQFNEVRLLIGRRCQSVKKKDSSGAEINIMINPDGARMIKLFAECVNEKEFLEALERAGADRNLIDGIKKSWGKVTQIFKDAVSSPFVQDKINQTKGWLNFLDQKCQDYANRP